MGFGSHVRALRKDRGIGLRKMAAALGVSPTMVSQVEHDRAMPGEEVIARWAQALGENPDVLLAMAGKVSRRLQEVILRRPKLFAELLEQLDTMPDHAVVCIAREVRDGKW